MNSTIADESLEFSMGNGPNQTKKKLYSELPHRQRHQISMVLYSAAKLNAQSDASAVNSNSCSYFDCGEVSCESSKVSVGSESEAKSRLRKRRFDETEGGIAEKDRGGAYQRLTRSNYGGKATKPTEKTKKTQKTRT